MLNSRNKFIRYWPLVFGLFSLQTLIAIIAIVASPSEVDKRLLLGLSAGRLVVVLALVGIACIAFFFSFYTTRHPTWRDETLDPIKNHRFWDLVLLVILVTIFASQTLLLILRGLAIDGEGFPYVGYANRFSPVLNLTTLCGMELFLWIVVLRSPDLSKFHNLFKPVLVIWLLLGSTVAFVFFTNIGLVADVQGSFGVPAVPLIEWQILLAWLTGLIIMLLGPHFKAFTVRHPDIWISVIIWVATSGLWLSQPINPAYFATPPRPPAFEIFPFSDALNYAVEAQSILIGNGMVAFFGGIPPRPFYIELLAWFHALAGQDYTHVIVVQTIFLAFFPVSLYLLGKEIGGRRLGLPVALLAVLRDVTSNQVANISDNITYSKLFFSELPVAMLLVIFILLIICWFKEPGRAGVKPAAAGGVLGLAMLIRTQSLVLLLVTFFIAVIWFGKKWKIWIGNFLALCLVLAITLFPWLWRNYQMTGGIIFDHPATQTMVLAQRYNDGQVIPQLPGESLSQYSNRLMRMTFMAIADRPTESLGFILGHFLNNEIDNLLIFPMRSDLKSVSDLFVPSQPFWQVLPTQLTFDQGILVGVYLLILGLGIAAAYQSAGWIGLIPLFSNLAYNLWTSIFRSSGGRFLVPMDWVFYLYGILGLLTITHVFFHFFTITDGQSRVNLYSFGGSKRSIPSLHPRLPAGRLVMVGVLFFLLGSSLPLSETLIPKRYQPEALTTLRSKLLDEQSLVGSGISRSHMNSILDREGLIVARGRAIYPRYYAAGDGEPKTAKLGYEPSSQSRLLFYFLSNEVDRLVILNVDSVPQVFPHPADVIVVGVDRGAYIEAFLVMVEMPKGAVVYKAQVDVP